MWGSRGRAGVGSMFQTPHFSSDSWVAASTPDTSQVLELQ